MHLPQTPLPGDSFKDQEGTLEVKGVTSSSIPPPILSDDMEAISDDEDLPDLPPPDIQEDEEDQPGEEGKIDHEYNS